LQKKKHTTHIAIREKSLEKANLESQSQIRRIVLEVRATTLRPCLYRNEGFYYVTKITLYNDDPVRFGAATPYPLSLEEYTNNLTVER